MSMKTFDEAIRSAMDQQEGLAHELTAPSNDHTDNAAYLEFLAMLSGHVAINPSEIDPVRRIVSTCAALVIAVNFGIWIGREMYGESATPATETIQ